MVYVVMIFLRFKEYSCDTESLPNLSMGTCRAVVTVVGEGRKIASKGIDFAVEFAGQRLIEFGEVLKSIKKEPKITMKDL